MRSARLVACAAVIAAAISSAACTSSKPPARTSATTTSPSPTGSPVSAASTSGTGSPSASPSPSSTTTLGGTCDSVLPLDAVDQAVGKTVVGKTTFIVNKPDPKLDQVERINCQYGVTTAKVGATTTTDAKVEVSVSLYSTDEQASKRIANTEDTWRGQGATPTAVSVSGHAAVVLIGYGKPLLVVAAGPRTVAVTMTAALVAAADLNNALTAVAAKALSGAGG